MLSYHIKSVFEYRFIQSQIYGSWMHSYWCCWCIYSDENILKDCICQIKTCMYYYMALHKFCFCGDVMLGGRDVYHIFTHLCDMILIAIPEHHQRQIVDIWLFQKYISVFTAPRKICAHPIKYTARWYLCFAFLTMFRFALIFSRDSLSWWSCENFEIIWNLEVLCLSMKIDIKY